MNSTLYSKLDYLKTITNPSDANIKEYHNISEQLTKSFIRREYTIGDKIQLSLNLCSADCGCYVKDRFIKQHNLDKDAIYTIKHIHYFGGGCPSTLLELEEVSSTHSYETALAANGFKVLN